MMERLENLAARLIAMAVSLVGDAGPVRKAMACSEYDFEAYCAGGKVPNQQEFERLVELIVREQGNLIAANRALLAEIREKPKHVSGG
jgi:hypothetical protein